MVTHYQRISDESAKAVASLVGKTPTALESPTFKIWMGPLHAFSLSLKLGVRDYCVFRNAPADGGGPLEHYGLSAFESDSAFGISKAVDEYGVLAQDRSEYWLSRRDKVVAVSLRERCFSFDEGDVYIDSSFVFFRNDGSRFAISASEQLICSVEFTEDPDTIDQILDQSRERLCFA